jgi:hypothetical protein
MLIDGLLRIEHERALPFEARMESLLLFRRALPSPTMCRFIPALSVPSTSRKVLFG